MIYDLIIIGGSAAGVTSGIYAARRGLNFLMIAKDMGGEVATSGEIGNWPGAPKTDGLKLAKEFEEHLKSYNPNIILNTKVNSVKKNGEDFRVETDKETYESKAVIISTGVHPKELNIPGEKEFRGKGVTYCTTCDGPLFQGKIVATIGGGNAALESALMMSGIAAKVYLINKNSQFKGEQVLIDKVASNPKIEVIYNALTSEIFGEDFVKGLRYKDDQREIKEINVDGIFVHIGQVPNAGLAGDELEKDQYGQIKVNSRCETNIPGLYAAGDVTDVAFKQIVIACGQGCIAALSAVEYINRLNS